MRDVRRRRQRRVRDPGQAVVRGRPTPYTGNVVFTPAGTAAKTPSSGDKMNGDMSAYGSGTNFGKPVMFKVQVHDGGDSDGSGDTFTFSTDDGACRVSRLLIEGHVEYEIGK